MTARTRAASRGRGLEGRRRVPLLPARRRRCWKRTSGATGSSARTYNAAMLAEALCKLEGFTYAPSDSVYWQHGHSTEQDFIYVTTQNLSHDQLQALRDEVGERPVTPGGLLRGVSGQGPDALPQSDASRRSPNAVLSRLRMGQRDGYSRCRSRTCPPLPPRFARHDAGSPQGQIAQGAHKRRSPCSARRRSHERDTPPSGRSIQSASVPDG